jgi:hypothetical protein
LVLIISDLFDDFEAIKPRPMLGSSQNHGRKTVAIPNIKGIHI